jgi:diguanylate cyclase (GGDEF)-like protein
LETGSYQTSLPFKLIEGEDAYVMFMPGYRSEDIIKLLTAKANQFDPNYIILIVLRSQQLLSLLENLLTESWGFTIYHNDRPSGDAAGWLVNRSLQKKSWLPVLGGEYQIDPGRKGFVMRLEKRFDLEAVSLDILLLAGLFSLIVFIMSRLFILRRYQRDILRSQREARLELLASYDALTQLPNRNQLLEWLQEGIAGVSPDASLAVLFIDVDEFKQVNDRYGHVAGDLVLQKIAERIKRVIRKDDLAVRLGGDEFVIVLNQITSDEQANEVVSKLSQGIEAPMTIKNEQVTVRASIGVALYPDSTDDPLQLINLADQVMYQAKRARYRRF